MRALEDEMAELKCEMIQVVPDEDGMGHEMPPCGKPRRRKTCCDDCFEAFITSGEFTREEAERCYPLLRAEDSASAPPQE